MAEQKLYRCDECGNEFVLTGPFAQARGTIAPVEVRVPYFCTKCDYEMRLVVWPQDDARTDDNQIVSIRNARDALRAVNKEEGND